MKLVIISDTHNLHRHFGIAGKWEKVPDGDVLIHCGDVTTHGSAEELFNFLDWFNKQPHKHKIFIGGNHDWCLDTGHSRNKGTEVNKDNFLDGYENIHYLEHDKIEIEGVVFYGHPYTPWHHGMGFNKQRGEELAEEHNKIPEGVNVLITHGPPAGIMDEEQNEEKVGSVSLLERVQQIKPKVHCFGHSHANWGKKEIDNVLFINAANHTWLWKSVGHTPPHVIEL